MSIEASVMTVWNYFCTDEAGCAVYHVRTGTGYAANSRKNTRSSDHRSVHAFTASAGICTDTLTGILLPQREDDMADGISSPIHVIPFYLIPGRDWIAIGDLSMYENPTAALDSGAPVYSVISAVQPPYISDGTLVQWCCFEAQRGIPSSGNP